MRLIALSLLVSLAACGFQPVYAPANIAQSGSVTVEEIDGRAGYVLRQNLQKQLAVGLPQQTEPARLSISLDERLVRLPFKPDGAASQSSVQVSARYTLSSETSEVSGQVSAETNFAVPDQPFGDTSAQTQANERAMRILAKRIVDDLRLKLSVD